MIRNGAALLSQGNCPIKNPEIEKIKLHGVSYGLGEAGYDIRLKQEIKFKGHKYAGETVHRIDGVIFPGYFALGSAIEEFDMPANLVGIVHDKSTWARKGLSVFNTVIEPGWKGFLTLELVYHGQENLIIPAGAGIAQVIFHQTMSDMSYNGKYQNQEDEPVSAIMPSDEPDWTGTKCCVCLYDQFNTPYGITCKNGHGGAPSSDALDTGPRKY